MANEIMNIPYTEYDNIIFYIFAIIYIIIQKYLYNTWQKKESKKRRSLWIEVLRKNEMIDECLFKFEKIKYLNNIYSFFSMMIGMIIGTIFIFILFFYFQDITSNMYISGALISLVNLIPFLFIVFTISFIEKNWTSLEKSNMIKCYFIGINWFVLITNLLSLYFFIYIVLHLNEFNESNLNGFIIIYVFSFTALASVIFASRRLEQQFYEKIETSLNNLYLNKFPNLEITTKEEKVNGNLEDIFNKKLIILNKNGLNVVVEWDSISSLKFHDKVIQNDLSLYY